MSSTKLSVLSYIADESSLIFAVIDISSDLREQEIPSLIRQFDPLGKRTIFVLTNLNTLPPYSLKQRIVVNLLKSEIEDYYPSGLDWHLLLLNPNAIGKGSSPKERNEREYAFFALKTPWMPLPPAQIGAEALRIRVHAALKTLQRTNSQANLSRDTM